MDDWGTDVIVSPNERFVVLLFSSNATAIVVSIFLDILLVMLVNFHVLFMANIV